MIFDNIKNRLDELSISTGTLPYILKPFKVDGNIKEYIPQRYLKEYTEGIAFFISEFYTRDDFHNYLMHSKEYFNLTNEDMRIDYMLQQLSKFEDGEQFNDWKNKQMHIALGIALFIIKNSCKAYEEVCSANLHLFEESIKIENGTLKEVLLFR